MFEFVRTHNRLLQALLGLIIFPLFIFAGVQNFSKFGGPEAETVATVDGKSVTRGEWDAEHRRMTERVRQQNPTVDPKLFDTAEARRQTLDQLIRQRVMQAAIFHQDLIVSDARFIEVLKTDPTYAPFLEADAETRKRMAAQAGLTLEGLAENIRQSIAQKQVLEPVSESAFVPAAFQNHALDTVLERREVQWQVFDPKAFLDQVQPTEPQVQAYYADPKHAADFRAPEQAQVEYVVLDLAALKSQVTVNEDDLKNYYEANKTKLFGSPEERRASHILVKVDAQAPAAERDKAKAKAQALLAEVRAHPETFADVAKKNSDDPGSAAQGGDLDWFARGAMTPPFDQAVFALKPDQISDVVPTDFGFHIIKLTGVRGGEVKPYAEVRPQIEDTRRRELAQQRYAELAEQFNEIVYTQGDSLQPAVDKFKLAKQTATVQRTPAPGAAGPLASKRLLDAIFSPDSLRKKQNTEAIETGPSQLAAARVVSFQPARQVPLAEVHDKVMQLVRESQARAAAKKAAEAQVAVLKKDPSVTLPKSAVVSRVQRADLPPLAIDTALKTDMHAGPAAVEVDETDGSAIAMRVVKSLPRDPADPVTTQVKSAVEHGVAEAEGEAFYALLKARYGTKIDEDAVKKALASAPAGPAAPEQPDQ